jgi:multidrug resistance efflux pump
MLAPYTPLADLAFILFCGSALDVAFNGNPLIKLDGYYFLSQWLRLPNLMDRAREWWRDSLRHIVFEEPNEAAARFSRREQAILAAFGLLSFVYTVALRLFIVIFLGSYLIDWFHLPGLLLTLALALFYARRPLGQSIAAAVSALRTLIASFRFYKTMKPLRRLRALCASLKPVRSTGSILEKSLRRLRALCASAVKRNSQVNRHFFLRFLNLFFPLLSAQMEATMATQDQTKHISSSGDSDEIKAGQKSSGRRRRLVPLAIALFVVLVLCLPWNASVGAYGALIAVPGQEAIIRAPESATLIELRVRPGDLTAAGAVIGRMSDIGLEEQLAHAQVELDRTNADRDRLLGELRAREESIARAEVNLRRRQRDYDESDSERRQIEERERSEPNMPNLQYLIASVIPTAPPAAGPAGGRRPGAPAVAYPAAIAVLQSEVDLRHARLLEASLHLDRTRRLHSQGIAPRSELERAETSASILAIELTATRQRLEASLIEHRRRHTGLTTEMQLARSDAGTERLRTAKLNGELRAVSALISTLTERRDLLRRRLAQFELVTPRPGAVFGEELPRLVGQYFPKGAEICRVAGTRRLLARIQASERVIGDVRVGHPVRLKVGAYPDQVFRGRVAKIGGESETDQTLAAG